MIPFPELTAEQQLWEGINLKYFFMFLSFQHPEVKQSDIAKELGITPATLSRVINSTYGDGSMRPEWINVLKPYLQSIDTQQIVSELNKMEAISEFYVTDARRRLICDIFSMEPIKSQWMLNPNWTLPNSFLCYGENNGVWHLFNLSDSKDITQQVNSIVTEYKGYLSKERENRFSFLCYDVSSFNNCISCLNRDYKKSYLSKNVTTFSAILVNTEQRCFEREYFAYPDD